MRSFPIDALADRARAKVAVEARDRLHVRGHAAPLAMSRRRALELKGRRAALRLVERLIGSGR